MASRAVLAYGTVQLDGCPQGNSCFYTKQSTSGFPLIFIFALILRLELNQLYA